MNPFAVAMRHERAVSDDLRQTPASDEFQASRHTRSARSHRPKINGPAVTLRGRGNTLAIERGHGGSVGSACSPNG
jgi:hypothetical protein